MQVAGIKGNENVQGSYRNPLQNQDPVSRDLQNRIEAKKQELQALSDKKELSPDEKMKKRQEIQKEITALTQELRQHEIEVRREAQEKQDNSKDMFGKDRDQSGEQKSAHGFSEQTAEALISAEGKFKAATAQSSVKTNLEGHAGVLESEIKMDKSRGNDTAKKEEELSKTEGKIAGAAKGQAATLSEANRDIKDAAEEERDEEEDVEKN